MTADHGMDDGPSDCALVTTTHRIDESTLVIPSTYFRSTVLMRSAESASEHECSPGWHKHSTHVPPFSMTSASHRAHHQLSWPIFPLCPDCITWDRQHLEESDFSFFLHNGKIHKHLPQFAQSQPQGPSEPFLLEIVRRRMRKMMKKRLGTLIHTP